MKKWKVLTFVFVALFTITAVYSVISTKAVMELRNDDSNEISLREPRLMAGSAQMDEVLREKYGIISWEDATISYLGETFTVSVNTGSDVLKVTGRVSEYEQWEILTVNGEEVTQ